MRAHGDDLQVAGNEPEALEVDPGLFCSLLFTGKKIQEFRILPPFSQVPPEALSPPPRGTPQTGGKKLNFCIDHGSRWVDLGTTLKWLGAVPERMGTTPATRERPRDTIRVKTPLGKRPPISSHAFARAPDREEHERAHLRLLRCAVPACGGRTLNRSMAPRAGTHAVDQRFDADDVRCGMHCVLVLCCCRWRPDCLRNKPRNIFGQGHGGRTQIIRLV